MTIIFNIPSKNKLTLLKNWQNKDNMKFYDNIPLDLLPNFATKGGLNTGCELDVIKTYITNAETILEVGAGYGRIIENLLTRNYQGKIVAVERSKQFCKLLYKKYNSKIEIIQGDIRYVTIHENFDLILWLWSGICDFDKSEQLLILEKVIAYLKQNGYLVLDSMLPSIKPANADKSANQYSLIPAGNYELRVYTPSPKEIENYASKLNLEPVKIIPYKTITNRDRVLYILSKKTKR